MVKQLQCLKGSLLSGIIYKKDKKFYFIVSAYRHAGTARPLVVLSGLQNKKCSIVIRSPDSYREYLRISIEKAGLIPLLNLYNLQLEIINFLYKNLREAECGASFCNDIR